MRLKNFLNLTAADFIVRSAYQIGKTPLLPIFAAALGAGDVVLGLIVSVSTVTGMVLKPLIGVLSDARGRRVWLLAGTGFFAIVPFFYQLVQTPAQLFAIRLIHGTATAIYGPVTLAYIAEQSLMAGEVKSGAENLERDNVLVAGERDPTLQPPPRARGGGAQGFVNNEPALRGWGQLPTKPSVRPQSRLAENFGWFGLARSGGYIVGPAMGGLLLTWLTPADVFTVIGVVSCVAFLPVLRLDESRSAQPAASPSAPKRAQFTALARRTADALRASGRTPAIWLSGGLESSVYVATYAIRAFLPVYGLSAGFSLLAAGLFFSVQEATLALLKPLAGRWSDHIGHRRAVGLGMAGLGGLLPLLGYAPNNAVLLAIAVGMGAVQALIFPATVALAARQLPRNHTGAGMGVIGTLNNAGKVIGPLLGGGLVAGLGYRPMFWVLGALLMLSAAIVAGWGRVLTFPMPVKKTSWSKRENSSLPSEGRAREGSNATTT